MLGKPTYEELEQLILTLKEDALRHAQTEDALRKSEERYRRITEAVTDYVFKVHIENGQPVETVHGSNCVAVTGYTPEDFSADPYLWIQMVPDEDQPLVKKQAQEVLQGKKTESIEHRIVRKDGVIRWVRNRLVPYYNQQGALCSYDGIVRDIDQRKRAEQALRKAHEELELRVEMRTAELLNANKNLQLEIKERKRLEKVLMQRERLKTLGIIAAEVAHEIRNPLVSIGGFAMRLRKKYSNIPECDIILSESQRLEKILSRIRHYLEPVEFHPTQCSINEVIAECLKLLSPEMESNHLRCVLELDPNLPTAYSDAGMLSQIFINLIRYSADNMEVGGNLYIKSFQNNQDLHIEFSNQNSGQTLENPETLFMPFADGGENFGLSLCYRLLKDMEAFISFVQENGYTIFDVVLPLKNQVSIPELLHDNFDLPGIYSKNRS